MVSLFIFQNKNENLNNLIDGFEANLAYYMSYEVLAKESDSVMNSLEESPQEFLTYFK